MDIAYEFSRDNIKALKRNRDKKKDREAKRRGCRLTGNFLKQKKTRNRPINICDQVSRHIHQI
ncbi:hypothetical protein ACFLZ0_02790 [Patescibacteria group bacterium]